MASQDEFDPVPLGPIADERHRPVTVRRKKVGTDIRVDATRVSGPIRVVLEPMLWLAFVMGVLWLLIAADPALRSDEPTGVPVYQYALPLGILVGALLLISSISALLWLPGSTTAARSRTAFAGLGMLASGWLFGKLHPVEARDFEGYSWFCIGVGALLVAICSVPWPVRPAREPGRLGGMRMLVVALLGLAFLVTAWLVWQAADEGLVGVTPDEQAGWTNLLPLLGLLALEVAAMRFVARMPSRGDQFHQDG